MMRPGIIALKAGDHATVARLQALCFEDPWGADGVARTVAMPGVFGLIVRVTTPRGRTPVGFALARVAADEAELLTIGVLPAWRGQGLAGRLLGVALAHALALGARHMLLEVAEDNGAARTLYMRRRFAVVGRRSSYYRRPGGPAADALIMRWTMPARAD
jgi:ribosomal-protein-alanine N-acetyltransferase